MGHGRYIPETPGEGAIIIGAGESRQLTLLLLPGDKSPGPIDVYLEGPGAEVEIDGLYLSGESDEVDIDITVHHIAPHCSSRQNLRGIVAGRAGFHGRIVVAPGADGTAAHQQNHNILLTDSAIAQSDPQLEIYADDVECSHGATVGHLDEDALFYLRSRGIDLEEARYLQLLSFISPVLGKFTHVEKRKIVAFLRKID